MNFSQSSYSWLLLKARTEIVQIYMVILKTVQISFLIIYIKKQF